MTTQQTVLVQALDEAEAVEAALRSVTPRSFLSSLRQVDWRYWTARTSKASFVASAEQLPDPERWTVAIAVTAL